MSTKNKPPPFSPGLGPPSLSATPRLHRAAVLVLLVAASSIAYLNADHDELFFDDAAGDLILNPLTGSLHDAFLAFWQSPLRPGEQLSRLTFALNSTFNQAVGLPRLEVTTFLAFNVMVHALNVCLVYLLMQR